MPLLPRSSSRVALLVLGLAIAACGRSAATTSAARVGEPGVTRPPDARVAEVAFDAPRGLGAGWRDLGWAPRELAPGQPAQLDLADRAGWILSRKGLSGQFGSVLLRYKAPPSFGDFLEVRLDSLRSGTFPRVPVSGDLRPGADGWIEVLVPVSALNPGGAPFDQIVLRARTDVGHEQVQVQMVALTFPSATAPATATPLPLGTAVSPPPLAAPAAPAGRPVHFAVDCRAPGRPISPMIYGVGGGDKEGSQWAMGIGAMRWGGNASTRYNWQIGNAWNSGADYFFRNVDYGNPPTYSYDQQLTDTLARGVANALTVPLIGWVAKDTRSYSFPVSVFGPQEAVASENPDMGNGKAKNGQVLPPTMPPTRTSVAAPPEFVAKWLTTIREKDKKRGRSVSMVILDNEPMLWNHTHRDVHPDPVGYDELLDRSVKYATAVRKAYPDALIAGPAEWGWTGYFYSAIDVVAGTRRAPDRNKHGGMPLLPWYLAQMRAQERKLGLKLLDVVDVHYYPQANNVGVERGGATDPATNALRLRSTRSLWDPSYKDESWIDDKVELFPRLRRWVAEHAPGLQISLGEYSFGAADHPSGGLAQAEALGRFGTEGILSAFYWFFPPRDSAAYWAFRAFRNFDGKGARFLDRSVPVRTKGELASLFVSRSETGDRLVAVLLNLDPDRPIAAEIDLTSCGRDYGERVFVYDGGRAGLVPGASAPASAGAIRRSAAPYTITVFDWTAR